MSAPRLLDALATARVVHDRATLEAAIVRMAGEIRAAYAEGEVPLYLTVMNGGLPFAAQLAFALGELGLDLEFDYLHATRYRGQTTGSGLAWLHRPATPMRGRKVLLADERRASAQARLAQVRETRSDDGATSGAIDVGNVA